MPSLAEHIASWMRRQAHEARANGFVVGLSGGVDSAVVARLSQIAMPGCVLGVILPCHSDPQDEADARRVAEHFALPAVGADLGAPYEALVAQARAALVQAPPDFARVEAPDAQGRLPLANVKPRLRMAALGLDPGEGVRVLAPLGYLDFLGLHADAALMLTDSGGAVAWQQSWPVAWWLSPDQWRTDETVSARYSLLPDVLPGDYELSVHLNTIEGYLTTDAARSAGRQITERTERGTPFPLGSLSL